MALGRMALALAALLAYQNRDKLGNLLRGAQQPGGAGQGARQGGIFDNISEALKGGSLNDILDRFRNAGKAETVDS